MDLAAVLEDPAQSAMFFTWNCNPLASSPDQTRLRAALGRSDLFTVVCDLFMTDTAAMADIVLPAASFLEFDDLVAPYFHHTLSAQAQVMAPVGEALPNQEIFRRLARTMGLTDAALYESDAALLDRLVAMTPFEGDFAALKAVGTARLFPTPRTQFPGMQFATPSGRIEIACQRLADQGLPLLPEPHADAPAAAGRLRILSPASAWQMNASYANDPAIRSRIGENVVILHPDEAAARGLAEGDRVVLSNETGALALGVSLDTIAPAGVGIVYKGRWPGAEPAGANVNVLHKGRKSDIGAATCVHSIEVDIDRAEAAE
jgi:anaerobic selenocysteine-containing dehydrogenase